MLKLDEKNRLFNFVSDFVTGLEMYLDNNSGKVTLYYEKLKGGVTLERLKILIADYISRNMLIETYKTVTIYQW